MSYYCIISITGPAVYFVQADPVAWVNKHDYNHFTQLL